MGGFAGGDEAGYWDTNDITSNKKKPRSFKVEELYDLVSFVPHKCTSFTIEGSKNTSLKENDIYRAYKAFSNFTDDTDIKEFFSSHKVLINQDSVLCTVAFIYLVKEVCNLILSDYELIQIGNSIGINETYFK